MIHMAVLRSTRMENGEVCVILSSVYSKQQQCVGNLAMYLQNPEASSLNMGELIGKGE